MPKYYLRKIKSEKRNDILNEFFRAVALLENFDEAAAFFKDLLSPQETMMLARRLQVAEMLEAGCTYEEIQPALSVGKATIARIQNWLSYGRNGYRTIVRRLWKDYEEKTAAFSRQQIRRRYAIYCWPEGLLDMLTDKILIEVKKRRKKLSVKKAMQAIP